MAAKDNTIIINNFQQGIAPSSYLGFEQSLNLNVHDKLGIAYPHSALTKNSGTNITALVTEFATGDTGTYGTDEDGNVFKTGTWTDITGHGTGGGQGINIWKDFLFYFRTTTIELYGLLSGTPGWNVSWAGEAINTAATHPSVVGQDGLLYVGCGKYIYSLEEVSGQTFDPTDAGTFTDTVYALDLPDDYTITTLVEYGSMLAIGTSNSTNKFSEIFFWDRVSESFDLPVRIAEPGGINQMVVLDNLLYVQAGLNATYYVTNQTSSQKLFSVPQTVLAQTNLLDFQRNAIMAFQGRVYFGIGSNSGGSTYGIYSYDPKTNVLVMEHTTSQGEGSTDGIKIGAMIPLVNNSYNFNVAWTNFTGSDTYGVDNVSGSLTRDEAYIITEFMRVGTKRLPRTFSSIEIQLSKVLTTNDSVKISYRTVQGGSWTAISQCTLDTVGQDSLEEDFGVTADNIQFKIIVNNDAELLEVRIK